MAVFTTPNPRSGLLSTVVIFLSVTLWAASISHSKFENCNGQDLVSSGIVRKSLGFFLYMLTVTGSEYLSEPLVVGSGARVIANL